MIDGYVDMDAPPVAPLRFQFQIADSFEGFNRPKPHIIKPVICKNETSGWIGAPGSMKSELACSLAAAAASGNDWFGFRNKAGAVGVAYFALERVDLVHRRLAAHRTRMGLATMPVAVIPGMVDLMREGTVADVLATMRAAESEMGVGIDLGIFDTTAKMIAASGGDEDKARDQGALFANIQRVKDATGIHAMLIGHTGKDETRGARGSNAILGDVDVMVQIAGGRIRTATVTKANDMADGQLFVFGSEVHEFGTDEDGDPISVNIAVEAEGAQLAQPDAPEARLTPNQKTMFAILHDAGSQGLTTEDWNDAARAAGVGCRRRADLHDIRAALKSKRLIRETMTGWAVIHD